MITYGTEHLSVEVFNDSYKIARPGDQIVYAIGDIATSRAVSDGLDLDYLAKRALQLAENGLVCLTQRATFDIFRNGGGRCFEYIATKCQQKLSARTKSPNSSSLVGEPATA